MPASRIARPGPVSVADIDPAETAWFTNTDVVDDFISNTGMLTETGAEVLTARTPETLIER